MPPIFFVHIPKTAGTSFRKAAEEFYSASHVVYDYSPASEETSPLILEWVYEKGDWLSCYHALEQANIAFLSGHVHARKYIHLFGISQTVTFLREPVQRLVSEYNHFVRHHGYQGDLASFYRKPQFINRQTKMLQRVPLEGIGFLGLTEEYEASLAMLNQLYGVNIPSVAMNMGRKDTHQGYELPEAQLEEIRSLNQDDINFYHKAVKLFSQRQSLFKADKPYVHGKMQPLSGKVLSGWAWYADNDTAVKVNIVVDSQLIDTVEAKELLPAQLSLAPPRHGYVGFQYNFAKPPAKGTKIQAVASETGQVLGQKRV
ncbi:MULTISPECIES: sulfotransferase family 2 domain-containing protein [Halomonadaceae]|uniref:Sulfotransferase family 2 domain-containing protein n=1 Tax=Vreelandella sp. SM1641 TaxID=3126101 RepID=A0AAU7XR36_9GAMM|nr:sulfotransferase family 2 domain-containing protein [Halomonas sp. KO116]AJY51404.1 Chondroitin 4-O-sulfotransferase [Halomonas sp. KO116]